MGETPFFLFLFLTSVLGRDKIIIPSKLGRRSYG